MATVFKLAATEGNGWVRQVIDGRPIVTGDAEEACEWSERGDATRAANGLNRLRRVQWRVVEDQPRPGGPKRFDPTNASVG